MLLVINLHRFLVYITIEKTNAERCVAEGVQFSNESVALYEYLTKTILILDSIDAIIGHYEEVGEANIQWVDLLTYKKNIH